MTRSANLPLLLALTVGAVGGWAGASGKFDSLLSAGPKPTEEVSTRCSLANGDCCATSGRSAALAALSEHNAKVSANLQKDGKKPNILVIMGDDIGIPQISAYTQGLMGYKTPNIDRIAKEGMLFTDSYGQQSCTAGRASFILGQEPFRTGLLTIGMPGDPHGIQDWMPTIADVMKTQGYATGQFGKNHLG